MKNTILFIGILTLVTYSGISQNEGTHINNESNSVNTYTNYNVNIVFEGSFDIIGNNHSEAKEYFYKAFEIIRFNENKKTITPNTQHLLSEEIPPIRLLEDTLLLGIDSMDLEKMDEIPSIIEETPPPSYSTLSNSFSYYNYLSSLFIMPKMSMKKFKKEIDCYLSGNQPFQIVKEIQEISKEDKTVLKWRVQSGKTRLDHYIVFGKEYNYLFVSSPYGSNGGIETTISEMKLI